ncbi:hypothetical protein ANANG_G00266050, partial [Anguilla anguilla]
MEDCLHASSEDLSKLVSWAHSHGTICALIPNLKHLLTEGAHGNLTAMWGCSAGHAYHWPLSATCRTGPKERACYQDSRSAGSDSLSLQGGSGTQASPGDRFPGRGRPRARATAARRGTRATSPTAASRRRPTTPRRTTAATCSTWSHSRRRPTRTPTFEPRLQSAAECHALPER